MRYPPSPAQVVNAGCAPKDLKHFEEQLGKFGGDVKMDILWDSRGLYALQGPKAVEVLQRLSGVDMSKVSFGESLWMTLEGVKCLVTRCGLAFAQHRSHRQSS